MIRVKDRAQRKIRVTDGIYIAEPNPDALRFTARGFGRSIARVIMRAFGRLQARGRGASNARTAMRGAAYPNQNGFGSSVSRVSLRSSLAGVARSVGGSVSRAILVAAFDYTPFVARSVGASISRVVLSAIGRMPGRSNGGSTSRVALGGIGGIPTNAQAGSSARSIIQGRGLSNQNGFGSSLSRASVIDAPAVGPLFLAHFDVTGGDVTLSAYTPDIGIGFTQLNGGLTVKNGLGYAEAEHITDALTEYLTESLSSDVKATAEVNFDSEPYGWILFIRAEANGGGTAVHNGWAQYFFTAGHRIYQIDTGGYTQRAGMTFGLPISDINFHTAEFWVDPATDTFYSQINGADQISYTSSTHATLDRTGIHSEGPTNSTGHKIREFVVDPFP